MRLSESVFGRTWAAIERWLLEPIDGRVQALVRISYALVSVAVLVELWPIRAALFGDDGISMRRPDLLFYLPLKYAESTLAVSALMVAALVAAVLVALGLFTRVASIALYLWTYSYCVIGYPAESGYDAILRLTSFVMMFAPTCRVWSLDARLFGRTEPQAMRYPMRLLQVQLAIIYVCTVWVKAPDSYWRNGELMAYFMMSMYSRMPWPEWAFWGRTSVLLTWGTLLMEACIPLFLFNARTRRAGFVLGLLLHGGIAATSTIGMFSLAMLPLYAAFLTAEDVELAQRWIARLRKSPTAALTPAER